MAAPDEIASVVSSIHAAPPKVAIVTTGGAAQLSAWLLTVPGASATVLEATTPYSREALAEYLGGDPESFCSRETAASMARAAYRRAAALAPPSDPSPLLGLAATCALATGRWKRGEHRAWAAVHDGTRTRVAGLNLEKGARDRAAEDAEASVLALTLLADASGVPCGLAAGAAGERVPEDVSDLGDPLRALVEGRAECVEVQPGPPGAPPRTLVDAPRRGRVVLPGSFNPVHAGHEALLDAAVRHVGGGAGGVFELSVQNADKGVLALGELRGRVEGVLRLGRGVVLTRAPLFTDKARLFPGAVFAVGHDTAIRLVMPKYYGGSEAEMTRQFAQLRGRGCRFVVAGRVPQGAGGAAGGFLTLDDVDVPACLRPLDMFSGLAESDFRSDLSSSELRRRRSAGGGD